MKTLVLALVLLSTPAVAGTSLTLAPLSPYQVLGVQCGAGTSVATATGFSGAYATTYTVASTRCGGSGRGGGYHVRTYNGCATARYTLTGELRDHASVPCTGADPSAVFTTDTGYSEATVSGRAVLTLPDVTPTASWSGPGSVSAPVGELTTFSAAIVNDGSVPLHVYSVSGSGTWLSSVSADCTEVDLAPGDACAFTVDVYPGSAEQSTTTITLSAETNSLTPSSFSQVVDIPEPPDAPTPPSPGPTVSVSFGQTACDSSYVCAFTPTDPSVVVSGVFSLADFSFTLANADGTVDVAQPVTLNLLPEADGMTYDVSGTSAVYDANGALTKTIAWTTTLFIPDGVTLSLLGGTLEITPQ
ncbi:MAG TPA: hypothetical protein VMR50_06745 [Myxococcota bacterium]|nr:hypothetical protein [Myxococcota bacterium]